MTKVKDFLYIFIVMAENEFFKNIPEILTTSMRKYYEQFINFSRELKICFYFLLGTQILSLLCFKVENQIHVEELQTSKLFVKIHH